MANSVDPDEMAHYELSHLDLDCLHRYLYWSTGLKTVLVNRVEKVSSGPADLGYAFFANSVHADQSASEDALFAIQYVNLY